MKKPIDKVSLQIYMTRAQREAIRKEFKRRHPSENLSGWVRRMLLEEFKK